MLDKKALTAYLTLLNNHEVADDVVGKHDARLREGNPIARVAEVACADVGLRPCGDLLGDGGAKSLGERFKV